MRKTLAPPARAEGVAAARAKPAAFLPRAFSLRALALLAAAIVLALASPMAASAQEPEYDSWNGIVDAMEEVLDGAYALYASGDAEAAKEEVNVAYYGFYEKLGFEKAVMAYVSGDRAAKVEYQFSAAKKAMAGGAGEADVRAALDTLAQLLRDDADQLDGRKESPASVFVASLLIIVREGAEAIIIVGAIIAYLVKSGNKANVRPVYIGSALALAASVAMAFVLNALAGAATGASQEVIEGVTMLLAVAVLFYVSNWMVGKAESETWSRYIEGKVQGSITRGSVFSLAFAAFLAVFREGAEVILFYQALMSGTASYGNMVWAGLYVGGAALVAIYLLIKLLSVKVPLKPFFLGTSVLMFAMSITFIGSGVKELQEGGAASVTPVPGIASVDILGIYPTAETLVPQLCLLAATVVTFVVQTRRWRKAREARGVGG